MELFFEALFEEPFFAAPFDDDLEADFVELFEADFLLALFVLLFLAAPLAEDFEALFLLALFALLFLAAPFEELLLAPFELDFEAPLLELLPAAFFAVAMLFEFNG